MNFARRLSKLERRRSLSGPARILVRFEGPGSEGLPQPTEPVDENAQVLVVQFVLTGAAAEMARANP
jgi:hypothetical protein